MKMSMVNRITAVFMAALMLVATAVVADAAVIDEAERRYLTDKLFEWVWRDDGLHDDYYTFTKTIVKIENDPIAATAYMSLEARVSVCDSNLLQEFSEGKISAKEFFKKDEFDYRKAKEMNSYFNDSLISGAEFGISGYEYGTWEFFDNDYNKFYGYFKEDDENFTLYEEGTDKVLGVYKKLIGYEYLDASDNDAGNGTNGGNGGSVGGGNGGTGASDQGNSNNASVSSDKDFANANTEMSSDSYFTNIDSDYSETTTMFESSTGIINDYPEVDNPAVTPEIVSMVDSMKSELADNDVNIPEDSNLELTQHSGSSVNGPAAVITVIAVVVIGGVIFLILRNKKGDKVEKN